MIKISSPHDWTWLGLDRPLVQAIPVSSRGLRGNDLNEFLKTASPDIASRMRDVKIHPDEQPVHIIALSATENAGYNRNGDGFKCASCRQYHDTFVKKARWYRNHRNQFAAGDPYYGRVRLSSFHDDMRRIELMAVLNMSKKAMDRNGGFIADQELEKIARGEDIPVSMASNVPYDVCSSCGNQAKTRREYCTERTCKTGGCSKYLGQLRKTASGDLVMQGVDNPINSWFDISKVWKNADRTAFAGPVDYMDKTASADMGELEGQAAIAEAMEKRSGSGFGLWSTQVLPKSEQEQIVCKVAKLARLANERKLDPQAESAIKRAFAVDRDLPSAAVAYALAGGPGSLDSLLAACADRRIILPIGDYASLTKSAGDAATAGRLVSAVLKRIEDGEVKVARELPEPSALGRSHAASMAAFELDAVKVASRGALASEPAAAAAIGTPTAAEADLAEKYAAYQVAAACRLVHNDPEIFQTLALATRLNEIH